MKLSESINDSQGEAGETLGNAAPQASIAGADYIREIVVNYRGPRRKTPEIQGPAEIAAFVRATLSDNSREHFLALFLDTRNRVIGFSTTAIGTKDSCPVHPGEIFQKAVLAGAARIVVAHNHPSGHPEPSNQDRDVTERLAKAGELMGIPLLDHVIVTEVSYYSFKEYCDV